MKFDMSAAWNDAMALIHGNREVLAIVAGVFFLLPGLAMAVLFAEEQARAMELLTTMLQGSALQDDPGMALDAAPGWFVAVSLLVFFVQLIGYLALLALMDGRRRPTVGEAIGKAFKGVLPLIGAVLLFTVGYFVVALVFSLVAGLIVGIAAATGSTALAGVLSAIVALAVVCAMFYVLVRLSLTLAEIVLGEKMNPIAAFAGSWRLTEGNSLRLFLFYLLLTIVYVVIYMLIFGVVFSVISMIFSGTLGGLILGLVSGILGAVFGVIWTAVMAAVYRQLSGPSAATVSETFE